MVQYSDTPNKTFRCLIADDSEFARKNIARIIAMMGGDVVGEAKNGLEATELYARLSPDLVLLDITMPELDGIDALRSIMEKNRNAAVIIVSSLGNKEMVWKALCLGAKHYVTKPYNPEYAQMIIKSVIDGAGGGPQ